MDKYAHILPDCYAIIHEGAEEFASAARASEDAPLKSLFVRYYHQCLHWEEELMEKLPPAEPEAPAAEMRKARESALSDKGRLVRCMNWQSSALGFYDRALMLALPQDVHLLLQHHRVLIHEGYRQLSRWLPVPACA